MAVAPGAEIARGARQCTGYENVGSKALGADLVTSARDAKLLCAAGYTLAGVTVFDMCPQTQHGEIVGWLSRG